jgi:hypothetical protein
MAPLSESGREIERFVETYGLTVRHGPFAGLRYPPIARGHVNFLAAKLLGAYESELHDSIEAIITAAPKQIVDVGSGEGYYVVGFAMRTPPSTRIHAFELDNGERRISVESARLNQVASRIVFGGYCDPGRLAATLIPGACLICDCEGYEVELLDPGLVPTLRQATMLVELHPTLRADAEEVICRRFRDTHSIAIIRMTSRDTQTFPELKNWPARSAYLLVSEGWRSEEERSSLVRCWAFIRPR